MMKHFSANSLILLFIEIICMVVCILPTWSQSDSANGRESTLKVGLPFSPWLTQDASTTENTSNGAGSYHSEMGLQPISWSTGLFFVLFVIDWQRRRVRGGPARASDLIAALLESTS